MPPVPALGDEDEIKTSHYTGVSDQGSDGICWAHACANVITSHLVQSRRIYKGEAQWVFDNVLNKILIDNGYDDEGRCARDVLHTICNNIGLECSELSYQEARYAVRILKKPLLASFKFTNLQYDEF